MTSKRRQSKRDREAAEAEAKAALEREQRLDIIVELLLVGADERGITRTARDERWNLEPDELAALVDDARVEIRSRAMRGATRDEMIADHLARLDALYRRAVKAGQPAQAAKILREQRQLAGLERVDRGAEATRRARPLPDWLQ